MPFPPLPSTTTPNLYTILSLPSPTSGRITSTSEIKAAVRRAFLLHHPDKSHSSLSSTPRHNNETVGFVSGLKDGQNSHHSSSSSVDINTVYLARDVLLDPTKRREYDRSLLLLQRDAAPHSFAFPHSPTQSTPAHHPTELETVDLDEMTYTSSSQTWTRACRCGNERAYEVTETDLETAVMCGVNEVEVGCEGCSLHVRVVFEAVEGEEGDVWDGENGGGVGR